MIDNKLIVIDQDLRKAYKLANYKLFDPSILFKIRQKNIYLKKLLDKHHADQAFFISAFNPRSTLLTEEENKLRHHQLQNKLLSFGGIIYEGIGEDPDKKWPSEFSYLVINISKQTSINIARFFEQLAIVEIDKNGFSQLLWINDGKI